jgi:hypothetical protein
VLRTELPIRLSRIPDPNFVHPGSEFFPSRIPDPGSASKNVRKYFNPKNCFLATLVLTFLDMVLDPGYLRPWIRDEKIRNRDKHPGSGTLLLQNLS